MRANPTIRALLKEFQSWILFACDTIFLAAVRNRRAASMKPSVVFVKADAIGDFVLWSTTLTSYSKLYPRDRFTWLLVGNQAWTDLAAGLEMFDEIIAVDTERFKNRISYRFGVLKKLATLSAQSVIHPTFSRDFLVGDALARAISSSEKIASMGDHSNQTPAEKKISDHFYSRLTPASPLLMHEFDRNIEFLRELGSSDPRSDSSPLKTLAEKTRFEVPNESYFLVFPDASWAGRQWSTESFAVAAKSIQEKTGLLCVIAGRNSNASAAFANLQVRSRTCKTSLPELLKLLRNAKLVLSNETAAVHMTAALGVPTVYVLGGGHFGRFAPYPKGQLRNHVAIYEKMDCFGCNWKCHLKHDPSGPVPCVSQLNVDQVFGAAIEVLGTQ
jgi:ADP-heptose:LPS heptosyltransferase